MKRGKSRHFGRDAEIQAMDGNQQVVQVLDSGDLPVPRAQWRRKPRIAPHGGAWRGMAGQPHPAQYAEYRYCALGYRSHAPAVFDA